MLVPTVAITTWLPCWARAMRRTRSCKKPSCVWSVSAPALREFAILRPMCSSSRNEALRFAGRRTRDQRRQMPLSSADLFLEAKTEDAGARALADLAAEALGKLNREQREVVELKIYGGLTFREIADLTGVPLPTAATRYRTALERLRAWLPSEWP